jgi:formylglycine-generating enzyme required for sulfatase activity
MPPEQAIGAIHKVDARSDVFGLGAILAVILTGQPPFVGKSAETTRLQAAQGNVEECHARLDESGAEPELVGLCKRCLSKKPDDRPADAGVVARAVARLRAAADERARQAELNRVKVEGDRATAEAKAEEQRKRRRVQLLLAWVVLLASVGGGIAAVRVQARREQDRIAADGDRAAATRQQERETRAAALVDSLAGAETPEVPRIVADLADLRELARPKLVERLAGANPGSKEHLHVGLALLPEDPAQVESLRQRLLTATPAEIAVVRLALAKHAAEVNPRLWSVAEDPAVAMDRRLRALAALAGLDPRSDRWTPLAGPLARRLVAESPLVVGEWLEVFRPVRPHLVPPLAAIYREPVSAGPDADLKQALAGFQRQAVAVSLLAEYAFDQPAQLADYLMDADADPWAVLWPPFTRVSDQGLPVLLGELTKTLPADLSPSDDRREKLAKRQANAAVALLRLNRPAVVWPLLKHGPDPRVRSYLIHRLYPLGADPAAIARRLDEETDLSVRRALVLALGEFDEATLPAASRTALLPKVQQMYRTDPDPGLHSASEWLLRTWKQEGWLTGVNEEWAKDKEGRDKKLAGIKELVTKDKEKTPPQWYVNTQGQTFVVIPGPVEFVMGSPDTEKDREVREDQHRRRIGRSFVIASKSVTLAQYRSLTKEKHEINEKYAYDPSLPTVSISWYMAAHYSNLLSKEEGIPEEQWCYEITGPQAVKLRENYLGLTGYRLPTEAEFEYATRAGAATSRYYGESEELLGQYAWYAKNSNNVPKPVGLKKPNDLGLFDVHGNCLTWCQEEYVKYATTKTDEVVEDKEGGLVIDSTRNRALRGGSFNYLARNIRSAYRNFHVPTFRTTNYGFRPARTIIP